MNAVVRSRSKSAAHMLFINLECAIVTRVLDSKPCAAPSARKPSANNGGPWPYRRGAVPSLQQVIDGGLLLVSGRPLPRRGPLTSAAISAPVARLEVMYCCVLSRPPCTLIPRRIERSVS